MVSKARLILGTPASYLATCLPVNFYGLADGKVCLIYSRFCDYNSNKSGLEFVFAIHEEFFYDYERNLLFTVDSEGEKRLISHELVDKPEPKIKIIKVARNLNSFGEAQKILNEFTSINVSFIDEGKFETDLS